jgi:hypothetical protein
MRTLCAALLAGAAFAAAPAAAQDTPQVTPPPIMVSPAPAPAPQPRIEIQPSAPVVQSIPSVAEQQRGVAAADAPAPAERRAAPARTARAATPAASRAAPATTRAPATPAEQPAAPAPAPVTEAQPAPATDTAPAQPAAEAPAAVAQTTTTQQAASTPIWPWLLGAALLVIAGAAVFLLSRRRRNEDVVTSEPAYAEPAYVAPVPVSPPPVPPVPVPVRTVEAPAIAPEVAASAPILPIVAADAVEEAEIASASEDDLAGVADAPAPVSNRPWIELGMRPLRAGTSEEEALVDFELTVGNAGDTPARDVRISSFMLAEEAEAGEIERLLLDHRGDTIVPPVSIPPGDGTRVDAHLAVPKGELGRTFNPVVVAEARYTLPDGQEARTSAAFRIGRPAFEGGIGAIGSSRPHVVDDLAAELYGQPEHA